jgi:hypothetical protein
MIQFSQVPCDWFSRHGAGGGYLLTISAGMCAPGLDHVIMARAVVDDFGNLVRVGGWF